VLDDLEEVLVTSDVGVTTTLKIIERIQARVARDKYVSTSELNNLLRDEVQNLLAENNSNDFQNFEYGNHKPYVIMVVGVNGVGKTTTIGKLAHQLKQTGNKVVLGAADTFRAAAVDQIQLWGERVGVRVVAQAMGSDPASVAYDTLRSAVSNNEDVAIIDTAGRLAIDEAMMQEIEQVKAAVNPHEILFVVDAMTGQDAVNTAKVFNDRLDFTGAVLTKLDGDTRGGAALSIKSVVNKPIKFIGTGEKMEALDVFHPDRMASRILGMGDVISLVERAQQQFDEKEAAELQKKIRKNKFDFTDFYSQIQQIKKMGNMKDLMGMIPGVGKMMKDVEIGDDAFKAIEAIIQSMTPYEKANPDTINQSRRTRIAKGSGTDIQEVNRLIKQFEDMRKIMKQVSNPAAMANMMRKMPKM